jgi:hypothetical protein
MIFLESTLTEINRVQANHSQSWPPGIKIKPVLEIIERVLERALYAHDRGARHGAGEDCGRDGRWGVGGKLELQLATGGLIGLASGFWAGGGAGACCAADGIGQAMSANTPRRPSRPRTPMIPTASGWLWRMTVLLDAMRVAGTSAGEGAAGVAPFRDVGRPGPAGVAGAVRRVRFWNRATINGTIGTSSG